MAALERAQVQPGGRPDIGVQHAFHELQRLPVYWALITLGPILFGVAFSVSGYAFARAQSASYAGVSDAVRLLSYVTPFLFGSAMTNFGVGEVLTALSELAPSPGPRPTVEGQRAPGDPEFSAFVFKIQANMNPRHRDRIAFVRVVSGRFTRGMDVKVLYTDIDVPYHDGSKGYYAEKGIKETK